MSSSRDSHRSHQVKGERLIPDLAWLPGESAFSFCSRIHAVLGHSDPEQTSQLLFGVQRGAVHDFPGHLDAWLERMPRRFGEQAMQLAFERTVLGFYKPFLTQDRAASALQRLRSGSMGTLKFQLGLLTSRFRAEHPLKACPACVSADQALHRVSYWHQCHQWPGTWVCPTHGELLLVDTKRAAAGARFAWSLPTGRHLKSIVTVPRSDQSRGQLLILLDRIARMAHRVASLDTHIRLDPATLVRAYRQALLKHGLQSALGRLDHEAIGNWFEEKFRPLACVPELQCLSTNAETAARQAIRVFLRPEASCHPLRHVALMSSLFEDWPDFWNTYRCSENAHRRPAAVSVLPEGKVPRGRYPAELQTRFRALLEGGASPSRAANELSIDVTTGLAWAAQAGFATRTRPKKLRVPLRKRLIEDLHGGLDKADAARRAGVSVETVTKVLRTEVGLHANWIATRQQQAGERARAAWLKAVDKHGALGTNAVRAHAGGAFAWLYRHDQAWLKLHLPSPSHQSTPRRTSVDWRQRDIALAEKVRAIPTAGSGSVKVLWQICLEVPELKAKINQIERLPRTRESIEVVLNRPWTRKTSI